MTASDLDQEIRASRRLIVTAIGFSAAINLLYFAAPLYFVQVFSRVLSSRSVETLAALSVIVALCVAAIAILEGARAVVVRRAGEGVDMAFAPGAVARALAPQAAGAPLGDLDRMARFYGSPQLIALLDLPWILVFVGALALLHPWLGVLALIGVAALGALAFASAHAKAARGRDASPAAARHGAALGRWTGGEGLAAALGVERPLAARWASTREDMLRAQSGAAETQAVWSAAARGVRLAFQCAAIGVGALLVLQDAIGPAALFAASLLIARALAPVEAGVGALSELRSVSSAAARLAAPAKPTLGKPALTWTAGPGMGRSLVVERLSHRSADGALTLQGVGFTLQPGEALGLVGPSGAGKSCLIGVLAGALAPSTGVMRLGAVPLSPGGAGYLPQGGGPLDGPVTDAIGCGRHDRAAVVAAAVALDLRDAIEGLPGGFDARLDEHVARLPAGVRQRLALARAICGAPPLVLLDEPTAHLDSNGERALLDAIGALKNDGAIVVVASHRPSVLGLADRLLVLERGRERASGPRNQILAELARGALQAVPKPAVARA